MGQIFQSKQGAAAAGVPDACKGVTVTDKEYKEARKSNAEKLDKLKKEVQEEVKKQREAAEELAKERESIKKEQADLNAEMKKMIRESKTKNHSHFFSKN